MVVAALGYGAFSLGSALRPAPDLSGTVLENPVNVRGVSLTNAAGEAVTLSDYEGRNLLVFFGFTRCPDVCPLTLSRLAKIYTDLGEPEDLDIMMITVDPVNDTPEVTHAYASAFHPSFTGLSGDEEAIISATKTFFVGARDAGNGQFAHTDAALLVDPKGFFKAVYTQDTLDGLEGDLRTLLGS